MVAREDARLLARVRAATLGIAFLSVLHAAPAAAGDGQSDTTFRAGLSARVEFSRPDGTPLDRPSTGEPFRISVSLFDEGARKPAASLHPAAWLRPVEETNLSCLESARAYRATGRLPRGTVDLNGILAGVHHDDATFSFVDPRLDLATSNILQMTPLEIEPKKIETDHDGRRVILSGADGATRTLAPGSDLADVPSLADAELIAAAGPGRLWAARGTRLDLVEGKGLSVSIPLTAAPRLLAALPAAEIELEDRNGPGAVLTEALALLEDGVAVLARPDSTSRRFSGPADPTAAAYARPADAVLFVDGGTRLTFSWGEGAPLTQAPLPASAGHVAVEPEGRLAITWSRTETAVAVIDIATAGVVQAVSFDRPIREVAFAGRSVFMLVDDLSSVMILDLSSAKPGHEPVVRKVSLGPPADIPPDAGPFLASLAPSPQVLALHRPTATVFVVQETGTAGMGPMSAFRLKGGAPKGLHVIDRSLREVAPGRYETVAIAPAGGRWELMMTTGIGGLSACFPVDVDGPAGAITRTLDIDVEPLRFEDATAGKPVRVRLALSGEGEALAFPQSLSFVFMAMNGEWRSNVLAEHSGSGWFEASVKLPGPGLYPVIPGFRAPDKFEISPGLLEVMR